MSDRYPTATFLPAARSAFRRGSPRRKVTRIILHITDGQKFAFRTAEMFSTPGCRHSAHFVVGQEGAIYQCVDLDDIAYHAHTANGLSIGIEHCARSPKEWDRSDPGMPLTELQIAASVKLVQWLCDRYGLPLDRAHVMGHKEADPATDHDDCPEGVAGGWPWARWCPDLTTAPG